MAKPNYSFAKHTRELEKEKKKEEKRKKKLAQNNDGIREEDTPTASNTFNTDEAF
jgi:hypothetical protein